MTWSISLVLALLGEGQASEVRTENRTCVSFGVSGRCLAGACRAQGATKRRLNTLNAFYLGLICLSWLFRSSALFEKPLQKALHEQNDEQHYDGYEAPADRVASFVTLSALFNELVA